MEALIPFVVLIAIGFVVSSVVIAEDYFKRVVNVRLETASLAEDFNGRRPMFSAELIAYGTALVPKA